MKSYRLHIVTMAILLCVTSGLVFAQDAQPEPAAAVAFDYSLDQWQYEGLFVTPEPTVAAVLPPDMETALVPCTAESTGACDLIATSAEDIVGVWRQYLGGPRFNAPGGMAYMRYNADGTWVIADSIENTAQPLEGYPTGTFSFDGAQFIIGPAADAPPPCDIPPHYQLRVLQYGDQPVALHYVSIDDTCPNRLQDLTQAGIWVGGE